MAGEIYAKRAIANAPNLYDIAAVLDLNGDGKLEVVVHSFYYEVAKAGLVRFLIGLGFEIYQGLEHFLERESVFAVTRFIAG